MKMKKSMKRIFSWMLVVCLLVSVIPAGEADAAAKFKRGTSDYNEEVLDATFDRRAEINGLYFWQSEDDHSLYCSTTPTGKGVELSPSSLGENIYFEKIILTDGTWVYYSVDAMTGDVNNCICKVKYDGTGFQQIVKSKDYGSLRLLSVYNGVLYYDKNCKLYSVGLKSGTIKLRASKFEPNYTTGSGRYIYGTSKSDSGTITLKAYDCKEKKNNKIVAFKSAEGRILATYKNEVYYYKIGAPVKYGNCAEKARPVTIYRTTLSGTGKRIKVHSIEDAYNVLGMVGSKIYYSAVNDPVSTRSFVYDVETGEKKQISFDEYAVNGSYNNFNGTFQ